MKVFEDLRKSGFARAMVDGEIIDLSEERQKLAKTKKSTPFTLWWIVLLCGKMQRAGLTTA